LAAAAALPHSLTAAEAAGAAAVPGSAVWAILAACCTAVWAILAACCTAVWAILASCCTADPGPNAVLWSGVSWEAES